MHPLEGGLTARDAREGKSVFVARRPTRFSRSPEKTHSFCRRCARAGPRSRGRVSQVIDARQIASLSCYQVLSAAQRGFCPIPLSRAKAEDGRVRSPAQRAPPVPGRLRTCTRRRAAARGIRARTAPCPCSEDRRLLV